MILKKFLQIFLSYIILSLWIYNISFAGDISNSKNINNNTNLTKKNKNIVINKKDKNWNIIKTITLSPKEIKNLEKEKGYLKILESIYKDNKKIFIWIIANKKLSEKLQWDPITLNISTRNFYVNSPKNQFLFWMFLEKTEALNFLSDLKKKKTITISIESDKKIIKFNISTNKILDNKVKYEYLFKLNENKKKDYSLIEIKTNNTEKGMFTITTKTNNYIVKKIKVIPWVLWYSSTWQVILFAIIIVIIFWTIIFWYLYNNMKKIK